MLFVYFHVEYFVCLFVVDRIILFKVYQEKKKEEKEKKKNESVECGSLVLYLLFAQEIVRKRGGHGKKKQKGENLVYAADLVLSSSSLA